MTMVNAAIRYAKRGWRVFPCKQDKKPLIKEWPKRATTDVKQIKEWWSRWPEANIAIATGKASGLLVIDVDKGAGGYASLRKWKKEHAGDIVTLRSKTGGGGTHLYFQYPACAVRCSNSVIARGIDVKGEGGCVTAPPSMHQSGDRYRWFRDKPIADVPVWLLEQIQNPNPIQKVKVGRREGEEGGGRWREGERNSSLFDLAQLMRAKGVEREEVLKQIMEINLAGFCTPPLPTAEVEQIVNSAFRYEDLEEMNEVGNGKRFAKQHRGKLLWCYDWKKWLVWDGRRWNPRTGEARALKAAKATAANIFIEATKMSLRGKDEQAKKLAAWASHSKTAYQIESMLKLAKGEDGIEAYSDQFDQQSYLFNCKNGTIDLTTGILHPHDPTQYLSRLAPVNYPAQLGEKAVFDKKMAPLWCRCLGEWMRGDQKMIDYLQRLMGYGLTASNESRVFPVFYGGGRNGKSKFLDTIRGLMGDYASEAPETLLKANSIFDRHPTEIADLEGRRFVVASELEEGMRLKCSLVKRLTGDETSKARKMREDLRTIRNTAKVILMTNKLPTIEETEQAIWDRVHLVPWRFRVSKKKDDQSLLEKLKKEWEGILVWVVEGCAKWLAAQKKFDVPEQIQVETARYRKDENPVKDFVEECTVPKQEGETKAERLYAAYREWWRDHREGRGKRMGQVQFGRCLTQLGYKNVQKRVVGGKRVRYRLGLMLKPAFR